MPKITINIDEEVKEIISKRADRNFFSLKEQIEDILRKSAARTKFKRARPRIKIDDRLVAAFSLDRRGRKKRSRKKRKK